MLFELKSVFQNEGEEKTISYQLDISNIDIDGVFHSKHRLILPQQQETGHHLLTLLWLSALTMCVAATDVEKNLQGR